MNNKKYKIRFVAASNSASSKQHRTPCCSKTKSILMILNYTTFKIVREMLLIDGCVKMRASKHRCDKHL